MTAQGASVEYYYIAVSIEQASEEIGRALRGIFPIVKVAFIGATLPCVPPNVYNLTMLRDLDLTGNYIQHLSPEIGKLIHLTTIRLNQNQLSSLPPEIGDCVNLSAILVDYNLLQRLPTTLKRLTRLTWISFLGNDLLPQAHKVARVGWSAEEVARVGWSAEDFSVRLLVSDIAKYYSSGARNAALCVALINKSLSMVHRDVARYILIPMLLATQNQKVWSKNKTLCR